MKVMTLYLLVFLLWDVSSKRVMKDIVRTMKFGNCNESYAETEGMSYFENIRITNIGKGLNVFNGQFVHKRDVNAIYAVYTTYKCDSPDHTNCELMYNDKHEDYCGIIERTGEYWTPLWGSFHPKAKCPLLKGTYNIINGTIDGEKLLAVGHDIPNIRNSYWITKTLMYTNDTKENFACMCTILHITQIKV